MIKNIIKQKLSYNSKSMETFKGRPRALSYPSPPDRSILANIKKPIHHDIYRVCECSKNPTEQSYNSKPKSIHSENGHENN